MKQETISNRTSVSRLTSDCGPTNLADLTQPDPQLLKKIKPIPHIAALLVILIGLSGLIGWAYNIDTLKRVLPGLASMKANTALSFVLLGIALWRLAPLDHIAPRRPLSMQRRLAQLCAFLVTLLGGLTLVQYFFGWELGLDQLLFRDEVRSIPAACRPLAQVIFCGEDEYRWHLARAVPLLDTNGQVIKWVGTATDIHERRQTELAQRLLVAVSEALAGPFDSTICLKQVAQLVVPDLADMCLVHLVENEQTIRLAAGVHRDPAKVSLIEAFAQAYPLDPQANVGAARVLRTRQAEMHGTFLNEHTANLNTDKRYQAFLAHLPHQATMLAPVLVHDRVLGTITFVRAAPIEPYQATDLSLAEELARRIALALENTRLYQEARTAEAELKILNTKLNQLVAERTAELERSNRELNQFAYIASHDLKAPLRAIANLAGWIQEDAFAVLPDSSKEHFAKLQSRIKRMEALLNDLLAYSRASRVEGSVKLVDSGALVKGIIEFLAPPPGFTITLDATMPKFMTASVPLETVLRNLIGNAIKHHNRPDGHVHIAAQEKAGLIEFMIRDDGPGIAPQYHERIFEMFQTLRPRDQVEGSGMGLTVVKKLVESRNGTLRVESAEGKGATFWFTWPISA